MDIQKAKNTLNIDYEYDKLNNIGQFALTYRKDNKTVKINEDDSVSIYYFKEGKGDLHLVSNSKIIGGEVKFDQASMGDSLSSGVYDIYSTIGGEIYPSQGYVKIKLETHVENGVQVTVLTGPKGDAGETGQAGKDAPTITGVNYTNNNLVFTLSDESTISTPLTLPAGPKGDTGLTGPKGNDAPKIDNVSLNDDVLTFALSDSTKYNVNLPLLKGDPGQAGKDAPKITSVNYTNNNLVFTLSDESTISTPLTLPAGPKGDAGEKGSDGLSAYQLALQQGFKGSEQDWLASLKGPQGPAGKDGKDGDGTKLARVYYDSMLRKKAIFENDDGTSIESDIFSDLNLPANASNLTRVSLLKSDQAPDLKPQILNAGLADTTIHVPFKLNSESPKTTSSSFNALDVHLDTSNLLDKKKGVQFKAVNDLATFTNFEWLAEKIRLSPDKHTMYVLIKPVSNQNIFPYLNLNSGWFENYVNDHLVVYFNEYDYSAPNLTGSNNDFPTGFSSDIIQVFSHVEKLAFSQLDIPGQITNFMLLYNSSSSPAFNIGYDEQTVPTDSWLAVNKYFAPSIGN